MSQDTQKQAANKVVNTQTGLNELKKFFNSAGVQKKFEEILGKKSTGFVSSLMQIVASSDKLQRADPVSLYQSAAMAATMDLPLNINLGFAYIIPYDLKQSDGSKKVVAQFQMGYKGFKQLALRTSQFKTIHATDVREGEIKKHDRLTGEIEFEWVENESERLKLPIVAYVSYFKLLNGYEQTFLMYMDKVKEHAKKYSKTYNLSNGLWSTSFDDMALKTVTKLNLSKNAPLSIDLQNAIISDQALIKDATTLDVEYVDHDEAVSEVEEKKQDLRNNKTNVDLP